MHTLVFVLFIQSFLPIFEVTDFLGLSLVNPESEPAQVTVTIGHADGFTTHSGGVSLGGREQRSLLLSEIVGRSPVAEWAWIAVESNPAGVAVFLAAGDESALAGAGPDESLTRDLWLPDIRVNTGFQELAHNDTRIAIVAPGFLPASVRLELFGLDGTLTGAITTAVPARGAGRVLVSEAFGEFIPDNGAGGRTFDGYIRLTSTLGVAAWQQVETPLVRRVLQGAGTDEMTEGSALAPYFIFGQGYRTTLNLVNPGDAPVELELAAVDASGARLGDPVTRTLAPGAALRGDVQDLFGISTILIFPEPIVSGYLRVRAPDPEARFLGSVDVRTIGQQLAPESGMAYPLAKPRDEWTIPLVMGSDGYYSGLALANPNELLAVQTDVTVEVFSSAGEPVETQQISLSPARLATLVPGAGLGAGWARVNSNMPIAALAALGSPAGRFLEQVPPP